MDIGHLTNRKSCLTLFALDFDFENIFISFTYEIQTNVKIDTIYHNFSCK